MMSDLEKQELYLKILHGLAGAKVDDVLASPESAEGHLTDADPMMRMAALSVLTRQFPSWEKLQSECERLAATDTDQMVRLRAKLCLAAFHQRHNNPQAARLFAEIVKDDAVCEEMRLSCYVLLMTVLRLPCENLPECFPDDVQWAIVDQALRE